MTFWQDFLDSLDTNGGHIFVLTFLACVGAMLSIKWDVMEGKALMEATGGALLLKLRDASSSAERRQQTKPSEPTPLSG